jgi:Leucine rich repeat/Leucine Rich repeats (2 copies)
MSSIKSRGRPIATQIIEPSTSPLISSITTTINAQTSALQQHYVPSLLKIESVVPTRLNASRTHQQRANRLIARSYSTLCGPAPATVAFGGIPNGAMAAINYKNITKKINTNLLRHKPLNGHESPTGKINGQPASDSSSIIVEAGVSKIRRTPKEKDKQPDRINLDRRGLCTIPVIDCEPNLRLLSLQHNLINTFHIPDAELPVDDRNGSSNNAKEVKEAEKVEKPASGKPAKPFLKQKSMSRNQLNLNFSANSGANGAAPLTPTSFLQKSFMFPPKSGLLKRANSVMINYSPSPPPQTRKLMPTPSFSVIDTQAPHEAANVKNELAIDTTVSLASFRFNLTNLVFLDLYNNQIEKIANLDGLKSLTVLLLGKNRISDISGLTSLKQTLRVLDLHGNRIAHIAQKICQLQELKSLNLAGNLLRQIQPTDFAGLCCLKELNLKRNRIKKINVSDDLHNLER